MFDAYTKESSTNQCGYNCHVVIFKDKINKFGFNKWVGERNIQLTA